MLKVVVYFLTEEARIEGIDLRALMYGKYMSAGFLFLFEDRMDGFWTSLSGKYTRTTWRSETARMYESGLTDFLLLPVEHEEAGRLYATCDACEKAGKPFNLYDVLLMHVPFREPEDRSVIEAPTLNNTQAVILILRECLDQDNQLRNALVGLNSRQTFLDDLYDRLRPYTLPVYWISLMRLVKWPAGVTDTPVCKIGSH